MRAGHVPTAVVGPLVAQLVEERWPWGDGYSVLAEKAECDESAIRQVVEQRYQGVQFDLADRLLTRLGRPDLVPMPKTFVETCRVPSCHHQFHERMPGGNVKRSCSTRCGSVWQAMQKGKGTGQRLRQRGYCLRGHRMVGENVRVDKRGQRQCRTCQRDYQREWARRRRMTDPIFLRKSTESKRRWRERQKLRLAA